MTTVIASSKLSTDCLEVIFEYLRNDQSSLFKCLLVNRLWCRLIIHLIWKSPFDVKNEKSFSNIIQTCISCLPDTEKQIIIDNVNSKAEIQFQQPLFIYPKYLQNLDLENFNKALRTWHKQYDKSYDESIPNFTISRLLIDFIFKECLALTRLNIYIWDKWCIPLNEMKFQLLFNREDGKNVLFNLKDFKFTFLAKEKSEGLQNFHQIIINLFKDIEKNTKNIQSLEMNFRRHRPPIQVDQAVRNLIKTQKNIRNCHIIEFWDPKNPGIYNTLMNNNNSLSYLKLSLSYFHESFFEGLLACKNLETLELLRCPEMTSVYLDSPLKGTCCIKNLKVGMNHPACNESLIFILGMCNINLRKLVLIGVDSIIVDAICLNNSQLTHLSIHAYQQIFDPPQSLSSLTNLIHLKLGNYQPSIFASNTLSYFIDSLPSSLQHLHYNFNIDKTSLKYILNECKIPLKSVEFHQSYNQDIEVFNDLINYKKLNQGIEIRLVIESPYTFNMNTVEEAKKYMEIHFEKSKTPSYDKNFDLW